MAFTHRSIFKTKSFNDSLHPSHQLVRRFIDPFPPLNVWSHGSVEYEERQEALTEKLGATKEKSAKLWIFAFFAILCVKEPYRGIDAYSKAAVGGAKFCEGKGGQCSD